MIKHAVLLKFKASLSADERQALYQTVADLEQVVDGWLGFAAGDNVSPEVGMDKGYNGGFIIDFKDEATRDTYLIHPEHQAAAMKLVAAVDGGADGIVVFDLKA